MPYNQLGVRTIKGGNVIRVGPDSIVSIAQHENAENGVVHGILSTLFFKDSGIV